MLRSTRSVSRLRFHEDLSEEDFAIVSIEFRGEPEAATDSLKAALRSEHLQATAIDGARVST